MQRKRLLLASLIIGLCATVSGCYYGADGINLAIGPPPNITTEPRSISVLAGDPAVFTIAIFSVAPSDFQWRRNGVPIFGANDRTYYLSATSPSDNGAQFAVQVCNNFGCTDSNSATLTVLPR